MPRLKKAIFFIAFLLFQTVEAQVFMWRPPLDIPLVITGGFGDIRNNHFHSGIDFSTQHQIRKSLFSISDGWVSRVRQKTAGFGKTLYITHYDGYTSVYAHMDEFEGKIKDFLIAYQLKHKENEVDFSLSKNDIPLKAGDFIGYTGDSGSSQAPHLHFELRDAETQATINPKELGFTMFDNIPPSINAVCIYSLGERPYHYKVNRKTIGLHEEHQGKITSKHIYTIPKDTYLGLGVSCFDLVNNASHHSGIYQLELYIDDLLIFDWEMNSFYFEQTKAVNSCTDRYNGYLFYKLFREPGNTVPMVVSSINYGKFLIKDTLEHTMRCVVRDFLKNQTEVELKMQAVDDLIIENPYTNGKIDAFFEWNKSNFFHAENFKIECPIGSLYDSYAFEYSIKKHKYKYSDEYQIGDRKVPLSKPYFLWIKPQNLPQKLWASAVMVNADGDVSVCKADGDYLRSTLSSFGSFHLDVDTQSPQITYLGNQKNKIEDLRFKVNEEGSGIKSYDAYLDGKWIPAELGHKSQIIVVRLKDFYVSKGNHQLLLVVQDCVGNTKKITEKFKY